MKHISHNRYKLNLHTVQRVLIHININTFFLALANSNYNLASAQGVPRLASLAAAIHALGKLYQNQDNLPADEIKTD